MSVQPFLRVVAAQGRDTVRVGPFALHVNPDSAAEGSNYAIPDDGAQPSPADVDALVDACRARDRRPRLEFLRSTAPAAETALRRAGFELELETPVMTCACGEERVPPAAPGLTLTALGTDALDADLEALTALQARAFGEVPDPGRAAWMRRAMGRWSVVLARVDGEPAGGGMTLDVVAATTELVGIATAQAHRGRGVAGGVVAELTRLARERGAETVFLTPGDRRAGRVYARAGFRDAGAVMLHLRAV